MVTNTTDTQLAVLLKEAKDNPSLLNGERFLMLVHLTPKDQLDGLLQPDSDVALILARRLSTLSRNPRWKLPEHLTPGTLALVAQTLRGQPCR